MMDAVESAADVGAISAEDQARAELYRLLAALLATPPAQELIKTLGRVDVPASDTGKDLTAAWGALKQMAQRAEASVVADEYQDLFIGIGRGELVPYGSYYVTGFLMEKPLAELRSDLQRFGFERRDGVHEPEDHVAALCETMGLIAASAEFDFAAQREFFEKHIDPWMGRFFGDLATARSAGFYRAVGLLGERFLEVERAYLSMLV